MGKNTEDLGATFAAFPLVQRSLIASIIAGVMRAQGRVETWERARNAIVQRAWNNEEGNEQVVIRQ